jgi:hypothetical protein
MKRLAISNWQKHFSLWLSGNQLGVRRLDGAFFFRGEQQSGDKPPHSKFLKYSHLTPPPGTPRLLSYQGCFSPIKYHGEPITPTPHAR